MVEDDKRPLLLTQDEPNQDDGFESSRQKVRSICTQQLGLTDALCVNNDAGTIHVTGGPAFAQPTEPDSVLAVFVVTFDTRSGNLVEWCLPEDMDLEGVEFKAMVSGSHTQTKDFVYFRKAGMFGLACFENMSVESEIERGARMKSVGILATSYTLLYRHMQFLEGQVRHQLEMPGSYEQLQAFYKDKHAVLGTSMDQVIVQVPSTSMPSTSDSLPEMKITHPAGCFTQFIQFFGAHVFTIWKYILLQKRLIFFSPPPIGVVCYRVYCACCLGNHGMRGMTRHEMRPHFYVSIADIGALETEIAYVACTTEKIFESKPHLYDVYIDNQNLKTQQPVLRDLLAVSSGDKARYDRLKRRRQEYMCSPHNQIEVDEEDLFTSFFTELNDRILQTLVEVSTSQDRQLTSDHMRLMELDPVSDRTFLMELVETYGIDVVLMVDNPCCPK